MSDAKSDKPAADNANPKQNLSVVPYNSIVTQVVEKIKNEPFLFLIAIVALLIGLFFIATSSGSNDLRFVMIVLVLLAFAGLIGYYVLAVIQERNKLLREQWKYEQQLHKDDHNQSATTPATTPVKQPSNPATSRLNTYNTHVHDTTGVAIGDQATVNQHLGASQLPSTNAATRETAATDAQRTDLEDLLAQHQRNLTRLQAKKAVYASGEEPLGLLNQIEQEEKEIAQLKARLG